MHQMSNPDTPSAKVISFPNGAPTEFAPAAPEDGPSDVEQSIRRLVEFLQERADSIDYMVAVIGERQPDDVPEDVMAAHHIYTTPIAAKDWALALKLMETSFSRRLTEM
jgi:hypothetical protein